MPRQANNTVARRIDELKQKVVEIKVTTENLPEPKGDILKLFKDNSAPRKDQANEHIVDVFPNFIPMICYIMLASIGHSNALDKAQHAKISTPTVIMYNMAIIYAFFLINDMYIRPSPSAHARSWLQTTFKKEFASFLLTLPMPEELETLLSQFHATETERSSNVFWIPSAAGFSVRTHFGRFIPLNFFAHIHDCTAEMPGNSKREDILQDLFSRTCYSHEILLKDKTTKVKFTAGIPDFIGLIASDDETAALHPNSKLVQVFTSVFNPVLFRDFQRRSSLSPISINHVKFGSTTEPNAYDILFSCTPSNIKELKVVLQAIANILPSSVKCSKTLGQIITAPTGISILEHGYSEFALPTWSANPKSTFSKVTKIKSIDPEDYAAAIKFLPTLDSTKYAASTPIESIKVISKDDPSKDLTSTTTISGMKYALHNVLASTNIWPKVDKSFVKFDELLHVHPKVLVLDISGESIITAPLATLAGKIIESFELDGTVISYPSFTQSIGIQNCEYADSLIPTNVCHHSFRFYPRDSDLIPPLSRVHRPRPTMIASGSILVDRTSIPVPRFHTKVIDSTVDNNVVMIPGLNYLSGVAWISQIQRFLGFRTVDPRTTEANKDSDLPPGMTKRLYVWSPYTVTTVESEDEFGTSVSGQRTYFLTNLRSFHGTDINMIEVKHPLEALPVV